MYAKSTLLFDCECNSEQKLNDLRVIMQRTLSMKTKKDINSNNKQAKPLGEYQFAFAS